MDDYFEMRLFSEEHLDKITEVNKNNPIFSENNANHIRWVKNAVDGLKGDDYRRIAFGVFHKKSLHSSPKLVCSVIVNKSDFSKKLALKNLIFHGSSNSYFTPYCENRRKCYTKLINHVKKFAATRGYEKLSSELISLYSNDKSLVQAFLECGFTISGNKNDVNEEWVYLDCPLSSLYSNDPYDYRAIGAWILKSYINATPKDNAYRHDYSKKNKAEIFWVGIDTPRPLDLFEYQLNSTSEPLLSEFNNSIHVMILPEYLHENNRKLEISKINIAIEGHPRLYIFSFCSKKFTQAFEEKLPNALKDSYSIKIIGSDTINKLISSSNFNSRNKARDTSFSVAEQQRFSLNNVHGLLSIADPDRISISGIKALLNAKQKPVYIKLGAKGKYLAEEDYLVLAYYGNGKKEDRGMLYIWAVLELHKVEFVDLNKQYKSPNKSNNPEDEADYVFRNIEEHSQTDLPPDQYTLWTRKAFRKHNKLNPINQVLCCWIENVLDFKNSPIPLEEMTGENADRLMELHEWNDSYLSEDELEIVEQKYKKSQSGNLTEVNTSIFPCSLTYLHSSSKNLPDVEIRESKYIEDAILNRNGLILEDGFQQLTNLDVSAWEKFRNEINRGIIHFTGHSNEESLTISKDRYLVQHDIPINQLEQFFQENIQQISMFIFNSCRSSNLAKMASKYCGLAIGYNNDLQPKIAIKFTEVFYSNLARSNFKNNTTLSTVAFVLKNTIETIGEAALYEFWCSGKKVDLSKERQNYDS